MSEPLPSPNFSRYALTGEQLARQDRIKAAAFEAFGNDHDLTGWIYQQSSEFGVWDSPKRVGSNSDEDLERVEARIAEPSKTTQQKWRPALKGRSSKRR